MNFHFTIEQAVDALEKEKAQRFIKLFEQGSMSIEYYAPVGTDPQKPHLQDELYIISSGSGIFYRDGERVNINKGEILFVPAGMEHRFENFTSDFATWVIFYGPPGGEAAK